MYVTASMKSRLWKELGLMSIIFNLILFIDLLK